jgi:hypothetical protein
VTDSKGQPKTFKLRTVLYAPDLKFNLLSVPAAVKDDFRFSFNRTQCAITTSQRFSVKAKMAAHADQYQFTADPTMDDPVYDALISMHGKKSIVLLHRRMGHPNFSILQAPPKNQAILDHELEGVGAQLDYSCSSCALAKSHRQPFDLNRVVERA